MRGIRWAAAVTGAVVVGSVLVSAPVEAKPVRTDWSASWQAVPAAADAAMVNSDHTFRNVVHLSAGGDAVRVHLSNAYGAAALNVERATVAVAESSSSSRIRPGSLRNLSFTGGTGARIGQGAQAVSDPLPMPVRAGTNLLVSVYVHGQPVAATIHPKANQRSYVSTGGDHTADTDGTAFTTPTDSWYYTSEVDVSGAAGTVVALGDSITNGDGSTSNANRRWTDFLANRQRKLAISNAGVSTEAGALSRFDRDVLATPGVRAVVIAEGLADVPSQSGPDGLIASLHQLAAQARAAGLAVVGGTLTPAPIFVGGKESVRLAVNSWIRHSADFDAVADFDQAVRDPRDPHRLRPVFDSGDHLHPSDAGYGAMAAAVPAIPAAHVTGWTGSWAAAQAWGEPGLNNDGYPGYTFRNRVHLSVGGNQLRVRLSHSFGGKPLVVQHATVALAGAGPAPVAGTLHDLQFDGQSDTKIANGASVLSDPVPLEVPAGADLLITVFTPEGAGPATSHSSSTQTSYFAKDGTDHAGDSDGSAFTNTTTSWYYVDEVAVLAPEVPGSVVTLGDSITEGAQSTRDANRRYPDQLAARLNALPPGQRLGVLNAGIGSNRILIDTPPAFPNGGLSMLRRIDTDVLARTGVRSMVVLGGINDIGAVPYATDPVVLSAGLCQLAERAHLSGLRVVAGTVLPWGNTGAYTPEREAVRQGFNGWIRTTDCVDGFVDFDALLRDPADPHRLSPAYDSGDHIHPNDEGYQVMANSVPLNLL